MKNNVGPVVGLPSEFEVHVVEARTLSGWNGIGMRTVDRVHSERMNSVLRSAGAGMKAVRHQLITAAELGMRMRVVDAARQGADEHRERHR